MEEQLVSLYDYLGKAAGSKLGKQVYEYVHNTKRNNLIKTREVKNSKYEGKVLLYPKYILDEYFKQDNLSF